jgi:hypothetical protein
MRRAGRKLVQGVFALHRQARGRWFESISAHYLYCCCNGLSRDDWSKPGRKSRRASLRRTASDAQGRTEGSAVELDPDG